MLHILFEFLECCVGVQLKKMRKLNIGLGRVSGQEKGPESGDGKGRRIGMEECSYAVPIT